MRKLYFTVLLIVCSSIVQAEDYENGALVQNKGGEPLIWDESVNTAVSPEAFWLSYANGLDSTFWGQTEDYPNYDDVNEFDTIMIKLKQGPCLMQFFHSRWRLANDVQRWNDYLNSYAGCPNVFD